MDDPLFAFSLRSSNKQKKPEQLLSPAVFLPESFSPSQALLSPKTNAKMVKMAPNNFLGPNSGPLKFVFPPDMDPNDPEVKKLMGPLAKDASSPERTPKMRKILGFRSPFKRQAPKTDNADASFAMMELDTPNRNKQSPSVGKTTLKSDDATADHPLIIEIPPDESPVAEGVLRKASKKLGKGVLTGAKAIGSATWDLFKSSMSLDLDDSSSGEEEEKKDELKKDKMADTEGSKFFVDRKKTVEFEGPKTAKKFRVEKYLELKNED